MKIAILGAVHGTTENDRLIFETYKAAIEYKFSDAEIVTPNTILAHKEEFLNNHPKANEAEALADMVRFDLNEVKSADLVVADVSLRSTGLGMELGLLVEGKSRLLLFAKKNCSFSDMIRGAFPQVKVNVYSDAAELAELLDKILK